jgi:hypothetical protein
VAYLYRRINTTTGLEECVGNVALKAFDEASFVVTAPGGVSEIVLDGYALLILNGAVTVIRNGQDLNEGVTLDFTQNVAANKIVFNYTIPYGSKLKIRVYSEKPQEAAFLVTASGGATEFILDGYVTLTSKAALAVLRNGQDLNEGPSNDFTRDIANNKIVFNYTVPRNSIVKIRA